MFNTNYADYFSNINLIREQIPEIGSSIPQDNEGNPLYENGMTPTEKKRSVTIVAIVVGSVAFFSLVFIAIWTNRLNLCFGLAPSGLMLLGGIFGITYYNSLKDLESPKTRLKEIALLREKKLSLGEMNDRYGGGHKIAAFALLGNTSKENYQSVANACAQAKEARKIFEEKGAEIEKNYLKASNPTQNPYRSATHAADVGKRFQEFRAKLQMAYQNTLHHIHHQFRALSF